MKIRSLFFPAIMTAAAVALFACMPPAPTPLSAESAALGISVEKRWASAFFGSVFPDRVYFVRWNAEGDLTKPAQIIPSNFHRGTTVYLLNAKPGRYSAVAATEFVHQRKAGGTGGLFARSSAADGIFQAPRGPTAAAGPAGLFAGQATPRVSVRLATESSAPGLWGMIAQDSGGTDQEAGDNDDEFVAYTTYFSEELVRETMVSVGPGDFKMMGQFKVEMAHGVHDGDAVQKYYHGSIHPGVDDPWGMPFMHRANSNASVAKQAGQRKDRETEASMLAQALEDLRGTAWAPRIEKQLQRLK